MSAVDTALWDLKGKHFREPVWRLLCDATRPSRHVTFGLLPRDQLVQAAKEFASQGHDKLKLKILFGT